MTDWWTQVRAVDALAVADALGMAPARGQGRTAVWSIEHPDCAGHGNGRPSVHYASEAGRLRCRVCERTWNALQLVALHLGVDMPVGGSWAGSAEVDQVRAEAASHGWCLPDADIDPTQRAIWAMQRQAKLDAQRAANAEQRRQRRATALDVGLGWSQLQREGTGWAEVCRWAREDRKLPEVLVEHLPSLDIAARPKSIPSVGVAGRELLAFAHRRGLHILFAMSDGAGEVQSVRTRWHKAGSPPAGDDGQVRKAMALPAKAIKAGPVDQWAGQVATFGSLEVAVDMAINGHPLVLVEGGPDYMTAAALCSRAGHGTVIGFPGDTAIRRVARYLRTELRARMAGQPGRRPRVILVPHTEERARKAAEDARRALRWTVDVGVAQLPEGQDINDIAAAHGARAVAELLSSARGGRHG